MPELMLTLTGLLPFAAGYGIHWMMTAYPDVRLPYGLIGLIFLLIWGGIAFLAGSFARRNPLAKIVCMNGVALVVLVLLGIQELVLGAYFSNAAGIWTQLYYLPLLQLGFSLSSLEQPGLYGRCGRMVADGRRVVSGIPVGTAAKCEVNSETSSSARKCRIPCAAVMFDCWGRKT